MDDYLGPIVGGLLAAGIVVCLIFSIFDSDNFDRQCTKMNGHTTSLTSTGIGFGANGKPVTTISSTTLCLSKDGRILATDN